MRSIVDDTIKEIVARYENGEEKEVFRDISNRTYEIPDVFSQEYASVKYQKIRHIMKQYKMYRQAIHIKTIIKKYNHSDITGAFKDINTLFRNKGIPKNLEDILSEIKYLTDDEAHVFLNIVKEYSFFKSAPFLKRICIQYTRGDVLGAFKNIDDNIGSSNAESITKYIDNLNERLEVLEMLEVKTSFDRLSSLITCYKNNSWYPIDYINACYHDLMMDKNKFLVGATYITELAILKDALNRMVEVVRARDKHRKQYSVMTRRRTTNIEKVRFILDVFSIETEPKTVKAYVYNLIGQNHSSIWKVRHNVRDELTKREWQLFNQVLYMVFGNDDYALVLDIINDEKTKLEDSLSRKPTRLKEQLKEVMNFGVSAEEEKKIYQFMEMYEAKYAKEKNILTKEDRIRNVLEFIANEKDLDKEIEFVKQSNISLKSIWRYRYSSELTARELELLNQVIGILCSEVPLGSYTIVYNVLTNMPDYHIFLNENNMSPANLYSRMNVVARYGLTKAEEKYFKQYVEKYKKYRDNLGKKTNKQSNTEVIE